MKRIVLSMMLCVPSVVLAQGGNCEPPMPEMCRSVSVPPIVEARIGGGGFRGKNRKPVPTRREAELLKRIEELKSRIKELESQLKPRPWQKSGWSPFDDRSHWSADDWKEFTGDIVVGGA